MIRLYNRKEAMVDYLKFAQRLKMYGVNLAIEDLRDTQLLLAVCAAGIYIIEFCNELTKREIFSHSSIGILFQMICIFILNPLKNFALSDIGKFLFQLLNVGN